MTDKIKNTLDYQIIPAAPGYWLWWRDDPKFQDPDGEPLFARCPIIAWVVERMRCIGGEEYCWAAPMPVTTEDVMTPDHNYAIEEPSGRVVLPEDTSYDNIAEAQTALKKRQAAE